jgi:DNA replicative helicase MCM subunit Mcm2 (Cdc46/Mcm family)
MDFDEVVKKRKMMREYQQGKQIPTDQQIIDNDAYEMLSEYFARIGESGNIVGLQRKFDTLLRIIVATAKLKLKDIAEKEDAQDIMEFYNVMLQQYKQIAPLIVKSPRDAAFEEILKVVKDLNGVRIKFTEAAHIACQKSSLVKHYLGDISKIDMNHKLRDILAIIERDRSIEITDRMPITMRWKQGQQDLNLGKNIDESDESDVDNAYPDYKK